ncbi:uncharacterized protein LOC109861223 [Pseudomyrmex gracilis]|uniref:uncharacterized protein LOC109861223 n=1 Tax=Pseudomyrmex gracilis TaxID=219809 RepID=UPI000994F2AB|nr:uncharacterized protein LOC109861223 [Pseudomyrmex gracilis]
MRLAREKIDLSALDIAETRVRKDVRRGGVILLEISGSNGSAKADRLAEALAPVLEGMAAVTRPVRRGKLRITGLDESVFADALVARLSSVEFGGCRVTDSKVGPMTEERDRLGAVQIKCPLEVATKVAEFGCLRVGWSSAKVALLPSRQLQCYKCLEFGHVRQSCKNPVDRSDACYRCGKPDHLSCSCPGPAWCVLCANRELSSVHRLGGEACPLRHKGRNGL